MDVGVFARGLLIGFSIAAPVGPIGVLCIRRALAGGALAGLLSGLGAATADACYGGIAGFGLTAVSTLLVRHQTWLRLAGGVFLLYLGIKTLLARPAEQAAAARRTGAGHAGLYLSTLLLTLTNPTTILSFVAVFAGLGVLAGRTPSYGTALLLIAGVFLGSTAWWCCLSGTVGLARRWVTVRTLRWVNALSGLIISGFGLLALLSVFV